MKTLQAELEREGLYFDKEIDGYKLEIEEWKKENEFLAVRLRSQTEVIPI